MVTLPDGPIGRERLLAALDLVREQIEVLCDLEPLYAAEFRAMVRALRHVYFFVVDTKEPIR